MVVTSSDDDRGIIGSCKYRNILVSLEELRLMEDYAGAMGYFGKKYYYLFSKSGFTKELKDVAEKYGNVGLIGMEELFGIE